MKKVYSPVQIWMGTFIGGPFAAMYFLKSNFDILGKPLLSKITIQIGLAASILLLLVLPFLPENFPNNIIPIIYFVPVVMVVKQHQLTKKEISESPEYDFHSSWQVFGISLGLMLVFFLIAMGDLFIFEQLGLVTQ